MENKIPGKENIENAAEICSRIRSDAQAEVSLSLERGSREADSIIARARAQAEQEKQSALKSLEAETQKIKERILSSLNLEKKRLYLAEKDKFVQAVLDEVSRQAQRLRESGGYAEFLEKAALEGIAVVGDSRIEVHYSELDEQIVRGGVIARIESGCGAVMKGQCALDFRKAGFRDPGVIVYSSDGRMMFDNRFSARLERIRQELSMELLRQSW